MTSLSQDDAIRHAVRRAGERPIAERACWSVYSDGRAVYVRSFKDEPPPNAEFICIAQRWDDKTVQVRFMGARIEWHHI